jgi:hypothetical protein
MSLGTIIGGTVFGLQGAGKVASYEAQKKQAKYLKQANTAQRQQDTLRAARERKEAIRAARLATGGALQAGVTQGVADTSAALGGLGSIQTQLNQNLSFLDQFNSLSDQAGLAIGKANKQASKAAVWNQVAEFGEKAAKVFAGG